MPMVTPSEARPSSCGAAPAKAIDVLELPLEHDHVACSRAVGSHSMTGFDNSPGGRARMRVGLPLCFLASFALHASLMAMSSVWMSGGASVAPKQSRASADEELETYTIYLRVPEPGSGADASGVAHVEGSSRAKSADDGAGASDRARATFEVAPSPSAESARSASAAPTEIASSRLEPASSPTASELASSSSASEPGASAADASPVTDARAAPAPTAESAAVAVAPLAGQSSALAPLVPVASLAADEIPPRSATTPSSSNAGSASSDAHVDAQGSTAQASSGGAQAAATDHVAGGARGDGANGEHDGAALTGANPSRGNGADGARADGGGSLAPGAVLTFGPRPSYPAQAVRRGEEGRVLCALHIDARGTVTRVEVLRSSGHELLDGAAVDALMRWRFLPAREAGRAVSCRVPHWVTFRLE